MNAALRIARALDRHLSRPTPIVVFGTGALLLDPTFEERLVGRVTNDIDLIIPQDREVEFEADTDFWNAIEATNRELEPAGLFLTHIFPEREVVLTPDWKDHVRAMHRPDFRHLQLFRPRMLDLILSKMGRGDARDLDDVRAMLALEPVSYHDVADAVTGARIPEVYAEIFPGARNRVLEALQHHESTHRRIGPSSPSRPEPPGTEV